ncbi:hypothetical protein [Mucilaginibacter sp.]|uniref:hypothetical protein n=1 Tax=Mucilaginibacter sp. TaxID=1882438 RepID=UPI00283D235E|nr:hypothetical protein [Mucilaginibacter sp.]MDR3694232.1 hypothetical protein [Mucilaginibacter sp.]
MKKLLEKLASVEELSILSIEKSKATFGGSVAYDSSVSQDISQKYDTSLSDDNSQAFDVG